MSCVCQLWGEADESKHKSEIFCDFSVWHGELWQRLSSICGHFMSCVVWELKQHPYSACLVLGWCYWAVNCNFHMNWLDFSYRKSSTKHPHSNLKSILGASWTCVWEPSLQTFDTASLISVGLRQRHQWPWLFSCHHRARGPIQCLIRSTKLSSGSLEMALQLFILGEGSVTIAVVLPFRLCSTCLFLKVKLQNQRLIFPLFILIKTFVSEVWLWQIHCFLYISASAAAKLQCKLHLCVLAAVTWGGVTEKPTPSEDFSVSWSLLLLRERTTNSTSFVIHWQN